MHSFPPPSLSSPAPGVCILYMPRASPHMGTKGAENHSLHQQHSPCQEPRESETRRKHWAPEGGERRNGGHSSFHANLSQLRVRFPSIHSSIFTSTNLLVASLLLIVWDLKFTESWLQHPARKRNCKLNLSHPKTLNPPTPLQEIRDIFYIRISQSWHYTDIWGWMILS